MPVKIPQKRVHHKDIPKVLQHFHRIHVLLFFNGIQNVLQLRSGAAMFRIDDGILDGAEVKQLTSVCGKIFAGADDLRLSPHIIRSQDGFLRGDPNHVEDGAGDVFADTAIRVGQLRSLSLTGRRKFEHILLALIFDCDLLSVGTVISTSGHTLAVCKIRHFIHPTETSDADNWHVHV